jgi:hypothetical protein
MRVHASIETLAVKLYVINGCCINNYQVTSLFDTSSRMQGRKSRRRRVRLKRSEEHKLQCACNAFKYPFPVSWDIQGWEKKSQPER